MDTDRTREIGGYIELEHYNLPMLHTNAIALNCGRNCLRYLIRAEKIKKIALPYFLCDSVRKVCTEENVNVRYYHIDNDFCPENLVTDDEEWVYLVNYYGQLSHEIITGYKNKFGKIIVDNAQAYFDAPLNGVNTLYTCRKFFGVADGAFLYTDSQESIEELEQDVSYERMVFILGRYEKTASEFYDLYAGNNELFDTEPVKRMSRLTTNLLHGIDYTAVKERRTCNYSYLYERLEDMNQLKLKKIEGAFAYPLLVDNGAIVRKELIKEKIYIPVLWPNVLKDVEPGSLDYRYAQNILPLPCDQRYGKSEMKRVCDLLEKKV